jgi:hypothetical protein
MTTPFVSQTQYGKNEAFELQVSRGQVQGHTAIFRSAYSTLITTGQNYAVWNRAANYSFPVSASTMTISSSATGDTTQLVLVTGLDANYLEISEVLTLNGQTAVTSTKSFFRVNDMLVLTDSPTGNIYFGTGAVTTGVPTNVYGFISAGDNSMMVGAYTVPAGHTLYIQGGSINCSLANQNKLVTVNFNTTIAGVRYSAAKIISSGGYQHYPYTPPLAVPEKSDLLDTATTTDASASTVTANLSGILIKNSTGY